MGAAITAEGFPAKLDTDFDIDTLRGFLQCRYDGREAGFEYYACSLDPENRRELELPLGLDFSVFLLTQARMEEVGAAISAASVLCKLTRGVLDDPQAGRRSVFGFRMPRVGPRPARTLTYVWRACFLSARCRRAHSVAEPRRTVQKRGRRLADWTHPA